MCLGWCLLLGSVDALLSPGCASIARQKKLNLTGFFTLSRKVILRKVVDYDSDNELGYLSQRTLDFQGVLLPDTCPCAVAVAAAWRYVILASQIDSGLSQSSFELVFHALRHAETWLLTSLQTCRLEEALWWPVEEAFAGFKAVIDMLAQRTKVVQEWATEWVQEPPLSDEQHLNALADAAAVLEALGLEWWVARGTLVALLRHGKRSGQLSQGRLDVVDHDVDIMVGLPSEGDWQHIGFAIQQGLVERGWQYCMEWASPRGTNNSEFSVADAHAVADVLMCYRKNPTLSLDLSTYITEGSIVYAQKYCIKRGDGAGCWYPHEGTFYQGHGKLRAAAIRPLGRCKAGSGSVPCPRKPLETLKAVFPPWFNVTCAALPDVELRVQRDRFKSDRDGWLAEGLTQEDVDILQARAADLDAEGFMSMTPYLDACWTDKRRPHQLEKARDQDR